MRPADWCFISGEVAAKETRLLTDEDFTEMLRQGSLEAVVARLRQSPGYEGVRAQDGEGLARAIERVTVTMTRRVAVQSPDPHAAGLLLLTYDFQQVNRWVKSRLHKRKFQGLDLSRLREADLEEAWAGNVDSPELWVRTMETVKRAAQAADRGPELDDEIDEALDRSELAALLDESTHTESPHIRQWCGEYTEDRTRLAVLRGRLAGLEPQRLSRLGHGLVGAIELDELVESPPERSIRELEAVGVAVEDSGEALSRFAVTVDDRMTDRLWEAKNVPFGPERVFGYAWGLRIEALNLKLIVESILLKADRDETRWRLRKSYA